MPKHYPVKVDLTKKQAHRLLRGGKVTFDPSQLGHGSHTLYLSKKQHERALHHHNSQQHWPFRMRPTQRVYHLENGEGFFGNAWNSVKSAFKSTPKVNPASQYLTTTEVRGVEGKAPTLKNKISTSAANAYNTVKGVFRKEDTNFKPSAKTEDYSKTDPQRTNGNIAQFPATTHYHKGVHGLPLGAKDFVPSTSFEPAPNTHIKTQQSQSTFYGVPGKDGKLQDGELHRQTTPYTNRAITYPKENHFGAGVDPIISAMNSLNHPLRSLTRNMKGKGIRRHHPYSRKRTNC